MTPMNSDDLKREWRGLSPTWIKEAREGRNSTREGLLDPPMLEACGNVSGLHVLDCGCGEGRFVRKLLAGGAASALGLDLCEPMIEAAKELQSDRDSYRVADVQALDFMPAETVDLAVSYLNQCDLPDFNANNKEVFRVLRRGGRFIVANLHPMRSAVGTWHRTAGGSKQHVILDNYFNEGERRWRILGSDPITNFHRTLETYVRSFLDAGFVIAGIVEPSMTPENLALYPELDDELRVPNFIIYILRKPL